MQKIKKIFLCNITWMVIAAFLYVVLAVLCAAKIFQGVPDVPAWAQAFGAIAGMGIAIWIPNQQTKKLQDQSEIRILKDELALITSIEAEIIVEYDTYNQSAGEQLANHQDNRVFDLIIPIEYSEGFIIYKGNATRICSVENESLRLKIIKTYSIASSLGISLNYNNDLIRKYRELGELNSRPESGNRYVVELMGARATAVRYAKLLVNMHNNMSQAATELKNEIREEIEYLSDFISQKENGLHTRRRSSTRAAHRQAPQLPN